MFNTQFILLSSTSLASTLDLNFVNGAPLDSRITFTRASGATYFDYTGTLQTAGNNVPRFDYDPVTLTLKGLLNEEQRTNLVTNSGDFTQAAYTKNGLAVTRSGTAPDGTTSNLVTEDTSTGDHHVHGTGMVISAGVATASVFIKGGTQRYISLRGENTGSSNYPWITVDTQTGTANVNSAVTSYTVTPLTGGYYRVSITYTGISVGGNGNLVIAGSNTSAAPPTSNVVGNSYTGTSQTWSAWGLQFEQASFATSYIPTTTAAATRAADNATFTAGDWYLGGNTPSWAAEFILSTPQPNYARIIAQATSGVSLIDVYPNFTVITYDGNGSAQTANAGVVNTVAKVATSWQSGVGAICLNAGTVATHAMATGFSSLTNTAIKLMGPDSGGSFAATGWIRRARYWPRALSNLELQQVTT